MPAATIELLAPARDLSCGIAAIDHGADAVYIGGPSFSARAAAGNSLADIERLIGYAHQYRARVYIALNTLLRDDELEEALAIAHAVWNAGADALIIQDMGLLECDLPPIPLHASTQTDNRTLAKVQFLAKVGFQQVVLARELNLEQIREIRLGSTVALECFVHGALCVSYSGQCHISERVTGRSANRGECAQFCRHSWTLVDAGGKVLEQGRYLLSLKDLDLSAQMADLMTAGITSFKIEGRLKDERYVKNVTAAYRLILDGLLAGKTNLRRASSGVCTFPFLPDTSRSFSRGKTEHFLMDPKSRSASINTPKAIGQDVGGVGEVDRHSFILVSEVVITNGDGLCFFDDHRQLVGFKANKVEGRRIFPRDPLNLKTGTRIYRNSDTDFARQLDRSAGCRHLGLDIRVEETATGLRLHLEDEDGCTSIHDKALEKTPARTAGKTAGVIIRQMSKSGGTIFAVRRVLADIDPHIHITAASLNELRREAFVRHLQARMAGYEHLQAPRKSNNAPWPADEVTCHATLTNQKARNFYSRHGAKHFHLAPGGLQAEEEVPLMTCKYCIKRQLEICPRENRVTVKLLEPLSLCDNTGCYELQFDCCKCEMRVLRRLNDSA